MEGRIHSTESFGAADGPGIRFVVFFQGCPLRCVYCHNPDTRIPSGGRSIRSGKLMEEILSYRNFIRSGGVTLSGGEPLMQKEFAKELLTLCRAHALHCVLDTTGCIPVAESREVIDLCDMLLLDIKAIGSDLSNAISGSDGKNTLETLEYCEKISKRVWIRHVLVPSFTLEHESIVSLAEYLSDFKCVERVDLLPFHKLGEHKWRELKYNYSLYDTPAVTVEEAEGARKLFDKHWKTNRGI